MTKRIGSPSHRLSAKHRRMMSTAASASMSPPTSSTDSAASPGHMSAMSKRISSSIGRIVQDVSTHATTIAKDLSGFGHIGASSNASASRGVAGHLALGTA